MVSPYFPYTFPITLRVSESWKWEYTIQVRDSSEAIVRVVALASGATITATLNEPAELVLSLPSDDPSVGALAGGNEIWIFDKADALVGKFRIGAGEREDVTSRSGNTTTVRAADYLSQLAEANIFQLEKTGTVEELVDVLLAYQLGGRLITAGAVPPSVASTVRTIRIEGQRTVLGALRDLERGLEPWLAFYVDGDRVLQWRDLTADGDSGVRLTSEKSLAGITARAEYDQWVTRVYGYGARPTGRPVTMGDGAQGWSVFVESSTAGVVVLRNVEAGYDDPSDLVGFESAAVPSVGQGDFLGQGDRESEIVSVVRDVGTTTVTLRADDWTLTPETGARLERRHLDSILYGMIFYQPILTAPTEFDAVGVADYDLVVQEISSAFASMGLDQQGRTARILFLADDAESVLSAVVTTLDPATGEIDATVTIPRVSGAQPTLIYMVLGWEVT